MTETIDQPTAASISDTIQPVGLRLRSQRESLGLSAEDIASSLKIPARKVNAIEAEQWEALPTGPYLKGFLRSYAKVLRIDPEQLIKEVDSSLMQSRSPDTILRMPQSFETPLPRPPVDASDWKKGRRMIYLGLALLVVIGLIIWSGTASFNELRARVETTVNNDVASDVASQVASLTTETSRTALPSPSLDAASAPSSPAGAETVTTMLATPAQIGSGLTAADVMSGSAAPESVAVAATSTPSTTNMPPGAPVAAGPATPASLTPAGSVPLVLSFTADTWVEIKQADGKLVMSRINPANTSVPLSVVPPADINIGNAAGIKLQYRNEPFDLSPYVRDNIVRLTLK